MELYIVHCDNEIDGVYSTLALAVAAAEAWYERPPPDLTQVDEGIWMVPGDETDDHLIIVRAELDVSLMEP